MRALRLVANMPGSRSSTDPSTRLAVLSSFPVQVCIALLGRSRFSTDRVARNGLAIFSIGMALVGMRDPRVAAHNCPRQVSRHTIQRRKCARLTTTRSKERGLLISAVLRSDRHARCLPTERQNTTAIAPNGNTRHGIASPVGPERVFHQECIRRHTPEVAADEPLYIAVRFTDEITALEAAGFSNLIGVERAETIRKKSRQSA